MDPSTIRKVSILGKESIRVGYGLIPYIVQTVLDTLPSSTYALITDSHVGQFHLPKFREEFAKGALIREREGKSKSKSRFLEYVIPPGEQSKSRGGKAQIEDFLLENACTRDTVILAVGGGVIGDLVGFVAATFMRGVKFVQVPTTLLAMVDSSVGGKTAIDTPHGKNLIGAFWQPEYIFIDAAFLGTLPPREFSNGMAEVVKTAAIWNEKEFDFLESHAEEILSTIQNTNISSGANSISKESAGLLISMIVGSISVKAHIVTIDERETGLRNLVNFGHSIGHAIEAVVTPSILHGECVAVGMILEAELSRQLGHLGQVAIGRLTRCLKAYHLPVTLSDGLFTKTPASSGLTTDRLLDIMRIDKKNSGPTKKIVLLSRIGATVEQRATGVPDEEIRKVLSDRVTVVPGIPSKDPVVMATPGSKSISNRALVLAALGQGTCRLKNLLHSDDTQVMMTALSELKGAQFSWEDNGETLVVKGGQGALSAPPPNREIYLSNAGTAARFLTTVCTLAAATDSAKATVITGNARMKQRPIGPLVDALRANGCTIEYRESTGCLPLKIDYGFKGGKIQLEASVSSQYVSSILLCAPYAQQEVILELVGETIISQPYIDMTIAMMKAFGIEVVRQNGPDGKLLNVYSIPKGVYTNPPEYAIESDASSATYPLAIAAITGTTCTVSNIGSASLQGDARFAKEILEPMGCEVVQTLDRTTVTGPPIGKLRALGIVDMEPMTDAFLTASVLAAVASQHSLPERWNEAHDAGRENVSRIVGIANQRVKECNRIRAMIDQLAKFGVVTKELDDGLEIYGQEHGQLKSGASVFCYDDHRVAMAFSVLASLIPKTVIEEKRCVEKTWPNWWDDLVNKIGLQVHGVDVVHSIASGSTSRISKSAGNVPGQPQSHPSIILVGLRGSGKTYIGRLAARALGWHFIDADVAFEERHGNLREFVRTKGWPAFRASESHLLEELLSTRPNNNIISLGGGIVETPAARESLKAYAQQGGSIVYLKRDLEEVLEYLGEEPNRPQYTESNREVCQRRIPWFQELATHKLTVDQDIGTTFGEIVSRDLTLPPIVAPGRRTYFITLTYPDVTGARKYINQLTAGVDVVELRVDLLSPSGLQVPSMETNIPPVTYVADQIGALRSMTFLPIIYTVRTQSQGGSFPDDDYEAAFKLLQLGLRMRCEFLDVELTLPQEHIDQLCKQRLPCTQIIGSFHDWTGELKWNSSTMRQKYNFAASFGDIVKIVSKANHMDDNFALGEFVRSVQAVSPKPIIAVNIGPLGQLSRILNETLTPVTHPALPTKGAPGQLSFAEIQRGLTVMGMLLPKRFYLFGKPISHSPSPVLHNTGFAELGLPHRYKLFETVEVDRDVEQAINDPSFGGASVTIPHKLSIIPLLDNLSPEAKMIGAVNTIIPRISPDTGAKELYGDNTDWLAIRNLVSRGLQQSITPSSTSLVIGAGGTSRAAIYALHALGIPTIYLFNRTKATALALIDSFPSSYNIQVLDKIDSFPANPPIVVVSTIPASATSLSTDSSTEMGSVVLLSSILASPRGGVVVDMAYKPIETPLLQLTARDERRIWKSVSGVEILIEQGCKQFELWTGRLAPKTIISEAVLRAYNS